MDKLITLKEMLNECKGFECTSNYYFELHQCPQTGEKQKVVLAYTLSEYSSEKIINFGICPDCNKIFYHEDWLSKSL